MKMTAKIAENENENCGDYLKSDTSPLRTTPGCGRWHRW